MKDYFMFGGKASTEWNAYIYDLDAFDSAKRSIDTIDIPGRNGALTLDNTQKFENQTVKYEIYIDADMQKNSSSLMNYLHSLKGYQRLEDTIQLDIFRKAIYTESISVDHKNKSKATVTLSFDCLPEKWLKSGEQVTTFTSDGIIANPTLFDAKPLIRVYGVGELEIGSETITIAKGATSYIDIDCDIQDCYEGLENRNGLVSLTDFPTLQSGDTGITLGTGITKVEITPRWWML